MIRVQNVHGAHTIRTRWSLF